MNLYLVSGASGFIGRALCAHIRQQGHRVRALLHTDTKGPWHESLQCDLRDPELPGQMMAGVHGLFHCAGAAHFRGLSGTQKSALWQLNVEGTRALLELARDSGVRRLVYLSSVQAAGQPGNVCATEDWQAPPDNIYGESKLAAEQLVNAAGDDGAMHACILRPALVYGPGVKGNLERMLGAVARGRMPSLPDSGKQRSMVALENLIEAAWLAMERDAAGGRTYIVCDDTGYSTRFLYESMQRALHRPLPRYTLPLFLFKLAARLGDLGNHLTDNAMPWDSAAYERLFGEARYSAASLKQELGWQPRINFEQALPSMVAALSEEGHSVPA